MNFLKRENSKNITSQYEGLSFAVLTDKYS